MDQSNIRRLLWWVLLINAGLFVAEIIAGLLADSMGLVADSLDMLADALVYTAALAVHSQDLARKAQVARMSGFLQLLLACAGLFEVVRRTLTAEEAPDHWTMILVSLVALAGNALSLWFLQRAKSDEPHIKASVIFTNNDVIINIGVIAAGLLVIATRSPVPDLVIGAAVFVIVLRGALRILRLSRAKAH